MLQDGSRGPPDPLDVELGARIKRYRQARRLSLAVVADAVGVSFQQIQKYEQGANRIAASTLQRIAKRMDVPVAYLYGESLDAGLAPEATALLRTPGAAALLDAYAEMPDAAARAALVRLAEAAAQPAAGREDERLLAARLAEARADERRLAPQRLAPERASFLAE
ncbi:MAG: transcriptional regulator, Cro/CI family [Caulobacter sp.]|nr:transcriptional regulator, Cro/CI family [Caulobacter sp.]